MHFTIMQDPNLVLQIWLPSCSRMFCSFLNASLFFLAKKIKPPPRQNKKRTTETGRRYSPGSLRLELPRFSNPVRIANGFPPTHTIAHTCNHTHTHAHATTHTHTQRTHMQPTHTHTHMQPTHAHATQTHTCNHWNTRTCNPHTQRTHPSVRPQNGLFPKALGPIVRKLELCCTFLRLWSGAPGVGWSGACGASLTGVVSTYAPITASSALRPSYTTESLLRFGV